MANTPTLRRLHLHALGRVQGVGFRPAVYRLARELRLAGYVKNDPAGVVIEIEGEPANVAEFLERLSARPPCRARIDGIKSEDMTATGEAGFAILPSKRSGDVLVGLPPDLATCDECRAELLDPADRRFRYPFINCTNCGPRFTIVRELPYDRLQTAMAGFVMCEKCLAEYYDPANRRFDAQPDACAKCGPRIHLVDTKGAVMGGDPVQETARLLRQGAVVAVKGVGGYHLACDARSDAAIGLLRARKNRPHKAFAVMFASIGEIKTHCRMTAAEEAELLSPARPVVALPLLPSSNLSRLVSPDTRDAGVFLPYTPLHILLLAEVSPLIMTSANAADEPMAKDEAELMRILGSIADYALTHNRPILRRCDDSVLKIAAGGRRIFFRRSRGFVPDPVMLPLGGPPVLACGGEQKNVFCVTRGNQALLSQHIGDLTDYAANNFYREQIGDLLRLLQIHPQIAAHDLHPDYLSTRYALKLEGVRTGAVQHHHAHIAACMAENGLREKVVGVALDGSGHGPDGTVWGGEFLVADYKEFRRAARFKPCRMPGGEEAVRHPGRMALSFLMSECGEEAADEHAGVLVPDMPAGEYAALKQIIRQGIHSPLTSSCGRLFDAVSALLGLCASATYEGQAAIRLQAAAVENVNESYPFDLSEKDGLLEVSFGPALRDIITDLKFGVGKGIISAKFHQAVADAVAAVCAAIRARDKLNRVALSGGVFQNDLLLRLVVDKLQRHEFETHTHNLVPPNDGGIALGQAAVALARLGE